MRYLIKTKTEPTRTIQISYEQLEIIEMFAHRKKMADFSVEFQLNDCVFTIKHEPEITEYELELGKNIMEGVKRSSIIGPTKVNKTPPEEHPTYPTDDFGIMQNVIQNGTDKPVEKDYEILQVYVNGDTAPRPYGSIHPDFWPSMVLKIHSVERLSDRKVFKVGDDTTYGKIESFQEEVRLFGKERNPVILVKMESIASFVQFALL